MPTSANLPDAFADTVFDSALGYFRIFSMYLGLRLGLYEELRDAGGLSAAELATHAGIDERYAREWLEQQATNGVLQVVPGVSPHTFRLPAHHAEVLLDQDSLAYAGAPIKQLASLRERGRPRGRRVPSWRRRAVRGLQRGGRRRAGRREPAALPHDPAERVAAGDRRLPRPAHRRARPGARHRMRARVVLDRAREGVPAGDASTGSTPTWSRPSGRGCTRRRWASTTACTSTRSTRRRSRVRPTSRWRSSASTT